MVQKSLSTLILLLGSIRLKKEDGHHHLSSCTFSLRNITKAILVEISISFFGRN